MTFGIILRAIIRSLRIRQRKTAWFRYVLESFEIIADRAYRGCEEVRVCERKEKRALRQAVESVNAQIKLFNSISKWRKGITMLAYLLG